MVNNNNVSMGARLVVLCSMICISLLTASAVGAGGTFGTKKEFLMTNVYDAFGKDLRGTQEDFGFSAVIKYNGKTILFDSGTDARIFERNLRALKVDLRTIDVAVVSHGHYDHVGGFDYLLSVNPKVKIYLPNDFFSLGAPTKFPFRETEPAAANDLSKDERYFGGDKVIEGMTTVPTGRFWRANAEYLTAAKEVLPGVTIIPTTATMMGTFIKYPPFETNPQFIGMPELSASFATDKGDVLISGCSHTTIETIIQETKKVRNEKIYLVAGGFHLIPYSREYIAGLAGRMKSEYGIDAVAPAHCTGHLGFTIFKAEFGSDYKFFGLGETVVVR